MSESSKEIRLSGTGQLVGFVHENAADLPEREDDLAEVVDLQALRSEREASGGR